MRSFLGGSVSRVVLLECYLERSALLPPLTPLKVGMGVSGVTSVKLSSLGKEIGRLPLFDVVFKMGLFMCLGLGSLSYFLLLKF